MEKITLKPIVARMAMVAYIVCIQRELMELSGDIIWMRWLAFRWGATGLIFILYKR